MNNMDHKSEVLELVTNLMRKIDKIPCHPRNKLQLYHRFVLSKIAWHFTIADIGKTWVTDNIESCISVYTPMARVTYQCYFKLFYPIEIKVWNEPYSAICKIYAVSSCS